MKPFFMIILLLISIPKSIFSIPVSSEIIEKGDRNLKIIFNVYEKYPFMPAKKEYYRGLESKWIKDKTYYKNAPSPEKKAAFDQLLLTYKTTNDVLKDICIDMANLTENIMDDFAEKLVEIESKRLKVKSDKYQNRFIVSRRQFLRAESGFQKLMFYYSVGLYDHGIDLMLSIYKDNNWELPGMTSLVNQINKKENLS